MGKNNNKKAKTPTGQACEKYEMAITDYVLDQEMSMSKDELFGHLANCEKCQKYAREMRATASVLKAQEYDARPESKKKFEEFLAKLHQAPLSGVTPQGEKFIDVRQEFGSKAGLVYNHLIKIPEAKARIDEMVKELGLTATIAGMSWLASEKKLGLSLSGKDVYAFLQR